MAPGRHPVSPYEFFYPAVGPGHHPLFVGSSVLAGCSVLVDCPVFAGCSVLVGCVVSVDCAVFVGFLVLVGCSLSHSTKCTRMACSPGIRADAYFSDPVLLVVFIFPNKGFLSTGKVPPYTGVTLGIRLQGKC